MVTKVIAVTGKTLFYPPPRYEEFEFQKRQTSGCRDGQKARPPVLPIMPIMRPPQSYISYCVTMPARPWLGGPPAVFFCVTSGLACPALYR